MIPDCRPRTLDLLPSNATRTSLPSGGDTLSERDVPHLAGLQRRQHLAREARICSMNISCGTPRVEADLDLIGARGFGSADDPFSHFLGRASGMFSACRSKSRMVMLRYPRGGGRGLHVLGRT